MLADPAADAAGGDDVDPIVGKDDRGGAKRAVIDADRAVLPSGAGAKMFVPHRQPHVHLLERCGEERAAGAVVHALQAITDDTGHFIGIDEGNSCTSIASWIDLNGVGRTDPNSLAAATAGAAEIVFGKRAGRTQPYRLRRNIGGELIGLGRQMIFKRADVLDDFLNRIK